jgi:pyoverdine/dityrosine biosynthesis protein Dit1
MYGGMPLEWLLENELMDMKDLPTSILVDMYKDVERKYSKQMIELTLRNRGLDKLLEKQFPEELI